MGSTIALSKTKCTNGHAINIVCDFEPVLTWFQAVITRMGLN